MKPKLHTQHSVSPHERQTQTHQHFLKTSSVRQPVKELRHPGKKESDAFKKHLEGDPDAVPIITNGFMLMEPETDPEPIENEKDLPDLIDSLCSEIDSYDSLPGNFTLVLPNMCEIEGHISVNNRAVLSVILKFSRRDLERLKGFERSAERRLFRRLGEPVHLLFMQKETL